MDPLIENFQDLSSILDTEGRLTLWPSSRKRFIQRRCLEYLIQFFIPNQVYSEKEVNNLLQQHHTFKDWALLRRELIDGHLLNRTPDGRKYWRILDS